MNNTPVNDRPARPVSLLCTAFTAAALVVGASLATPASPATSTLSPVAASEALSYTKEFHTIDNSILPLFNGKRINIALFRPQNADPARVLFLEHGRNGRADSRSMMQIAETYLENGYTVISVNAANSQWNDSEGESHDFTIAEHIRDLKRAIEWARNNPGLSGWDGSNFALAGHSMGGHAAARIASDDNYSDNVTHVMLIAPVISGTRHIETRSKSPGALERLRQAVNNALNEWPQHDLYDHIENLTAPVCMLVGEIDSVTLPVTIQEFYSRLPDPAGLAIISGQHHTMHGTAFKKEMQNCLKNLESKATPSVPTPSAARNPLAP